MPRLTALSTRTSLPLSTYTLLLVKRIAFPQQSNTNTPPHALNLDSFYLLKNILFKLPIFLPILTVSLSTRSFQQVNMLLWHPLKKFPGHHVPVWLLFHFLLCFTEKLQERKFYNCLYNFTSHSLLDIYFQSRLYFPQHLKFLRSLNASNTS